MYSPLALVLAFLALDAILFANAEIYVIEPSAGSTCHAGQTCTVVWLDDGESPLLSTIGISTIGLFHGNQQLVQSITPADVSSVHSLNFTPIANAGPNSDTYYLAFQSTTLKVNGSAYSAFSPFFKLAGMSGSFSSPLASATSTIPIPSSLADSTTANKVESTITVGKLSTSLPPITSLSATTPLSSPSPSQSPSSQSSSTRSSTSSSSALGSGSASTTAAPSTASNAALPRTNSLLFPILGVLSLCFLLSHLA